MKYLLMFCFLASLLFAQERYSQIELSVPSRQALQRIGDLGIAVDHFDGKIGGTVSLFVNKSEMKLLQDAGITYTERIHDWKEYYAARQAHSAPMRQTGSDSLKYFSPGSNGGHFTLAEIESQLLFMKQTFSYLITSKIVIGKSYENRDMYAVKISVDPDVNDASKPEVLYTALHHAREPQGMTGLIYYMWWLLENYNKDPEATYLLNNRQLWFIPVVNPDGYVFNGNGGMWRKNRRELTGGNIGVDLNRNYGTYEMWNAPNNGSSTILSSDTYRGTEPFSEPETQAIRNFMLSHKIKTCFNYHTYGNYLIYPWGYTSAESNDSLLFRYWTYTMSANNRYAIGTDMQTVGYSTRGNSDDYMYGDTSKPRAYAMTPEIGLSGFWSAASEIIPMAKQNLLQNKMLAHVAGSYPSISSYSVQNDVCTVQLRNIGTDTLYDFPILLSTANGVVPPSIPSGTIPPFGKRQVEFNISPAHGKQKITVYLKDQTDIFNQGGVMNDSISYYTGTPTILLYDSGAVSNLWSTGTGWGVSSDAIDNNPYFTDSPSGSYAANGENSLTLLSPISLTGYRYAELTFRTKWAIESIWDFAVIEVSTNGGTNWTSVRTQCSRKGSGRSGSKQPSSTYGFDAFNPGLSWIDQTADLSAFAGQQIKIRFRLSSDGADQRDGWYLDDIRILGYAEAPTAVTGTQTPYTYSLEQNFPNPFNPSSTIQFTVEKPGRSSLRIFNALGQETAILVDQELAPGHYSINFDGSLLSSGVYFYRFTSGNFVSIKKMTLVK